MQTFASVQDLANITQQPVKTVQGKLALEVATARIIAACGTSFGFYDHDVVRLEGCQSLAMLPGPPVLEVHSVRIRGGDGSWAFLPLGNGYQVSQGALAIAEPGLIEVTYTHGYQVIPADVKGCCLQLAAEHMAGADGLLFERIDDYSSRVAEPGKSPGALMLAELAARYSSGRVYMVSLR